MAALIIAVGGALDFQRRAAAAAVIQEAADAAVLAAAALPGAAAAKEAKASQVFAANLGGRYPGAALALTIDGARYSARVDYGLETTLLKIAQRDTLAIGVDAVAMALTRDTCLVVLDPAAPQALLADSNARIAAPDCDIRVNSTSGSAITALSSTQISASASCAAGGYSGSDARYAPVPDAGCSVFIDPLAALPAPPAAGCDHVNRVVDNQTLLLSPGIYCGGLSIINNSAVTLGAGVYVMRNGPLRVDSNATLAGDAVMIHLTGAGAVLDFDSNSSIALAAPDSGIYEGVLFYEDRAQPALLEHRIRSNNVSALTGVIYLPQGRLTLDSNSVIGAASPWTALIVRRLTALSNVELRINASYDATTIRRPPALAAGEVRLIR